MYTFEQIVHFEGSDNKSNYMFIVIIFTDFSSLLISWNYRMVYDKPIRRLVEQ